MSCQYCSKCQEGLNPNIRDFVKGDIMCSNCDTMNEVVNAKEDLAYRLEDLEARVEVIERKIAE